MANTEVHYNAAVEITLMRLYLTADYMLIANLIFQGAYILFG